MHIQPWPEHLRGGSSTTVRMVGGTTVLTMRYAAGNAGRLLLENLLPIIKLGQVLDSEYTLRGFQGLILDNCSVQSDYDLMWAYPRCEAMEEFYRTLLMPIEPSASLDTLRSLQDANSTTFLCFERALLGVGGKTTLVKNTPQQGQAEALRLGTRSGAVAQSLRDHCWTAAPA